MKESYTSCWIVFSCLSWKLGNGRSYGFFDLKVEGGKINCWHFLHYVSDNSSQSPPYAQMKYAAL